MKNEDKRKISEIIFLIIAVLCFISGIALLMQNNGTIFFLIMILLGFIFIALAYMIHNKLWKKIPKWIRVGIVTCFSIMMGIFIFVEGLILTQINARGEENLDYIIVLGALVREDGPSSILKARLDAAVDYLEENPNTKCIVSGGQGKNEPYSEAEGMRRYLVKEGIDESRIIIEDKSTNTVENIQNSMKLIEKENPRVGIVTSNFHVYRGVGIAKKQGLTDVCGIAGDVHPVYLPVNMFREFFGVVKDTVLGNMTCMVN